MSGRQNGGDVVTQAACGDPDFGARARDYVLGALEPESAERMEDHLAGCPACSARVTQYETGLRRLEHDAQGQRRSIRLPLLALAAALCVASALALWQGAKTPAPGDGPWRSPGRPFELLAPAGPTATPPAELRFTAPETRDDCRAEIVRLDLTPLFEARASTPGLVAIPDATRAALASGEEFLWRVRCDGPSGEETSSYQAFRVVTSPAPERDGAPRESPPR